MTMEQDAYVKITTRMTFCGWFNLNVYLRFLTFVRDVFSVDIDKYLENMFNDLESNTSRYLKVTVERISKEEYLNARPEERQETCD